MNMKDKSPSPINPPAISKNPKIKKVNKANKTAVLGSRAFKLSYLTKKLTQDINIPPLIRILDFVFPIESGFTDDMLNPEDKFKYRHSVLGSLGKFKRLTFITHSSVHKEFTYRIEERFPNPQLWKGMENVPEFLNFLGKLNSKNADLLVLTLQN